MGHRSVIDVEAAKDGAHAGGTLSGFAVMDGGILQATQFNEQVTRLAERLSVPPHRAEDGFAACLSGKDGRAYDLIKLLHAALDRIERALPVE